MRKYSVMIFLAMILLTACQAGGIETKMVPESYTIASEDEYVEEQDEKTRSEAQQQDENIEVPEKDIFAEIYIDISVTRSDGEGDCGVMPWGVDHIDGGDYSCVPPKYWFGYDLQATAHQYVNLVPQGKGWVLTPRSKGGGAYQKALHWSDGQRVCEPASLKAEPFEFSVDGAIADGEIVLEINTRPVELATWECDNGNTYERETTLLLIDWSMAVSGFYDSLTTLLTRADQVSQSCYHHLYVLDTNPSPVNRDHVEVDVSFTCMQSGQDESISVECACPW